MKQTVLLCFIFSIIFFSCNDEAKYNVFDDDNAIRKAREGSITIGGFPKSNTDKLYSIEVKNYFTGMKTIKWMEGGEKLDINLTIISGRFKIMLVEAYSEDMVRIIMDKLSKRFEPKINDNNIILVTDESVDQTFEFPELSGTKYWLRIVGDHSAFKLKVKYY